MYGPLLGTLNISPLLALITQHNCENEQHVKFPPQESNTTQGIRIRAADCEFRGFFRREKNGSRMILFFRACGHILPVFLDDGLWRVAVVGKINSNV